MCSLLKGKIKRARCRLRCCRSRFGYCSSVKSALLAHGPISRPWSSPRAVQRTDRTAKRSAMRHEGRPFYTCRRNSHCKLARYYQKSVRASLIPEIINPATVIILIISSHFVTSSVSASPPSWWTWDVSTSITQIWTRQCQEIDLA